MITDWFIQLGAGFALWIVSLFPSITIPSGLINIDDTINGIFSTMGEGFGVLGDWPFIGAMAALPLVAWTAGLLVKGVRILISHIPFFGGK